MLNPTKAGLVEQVGWREVFYMEDGIESVAVLESTSDPMIKRLMIDGVTIGESGGGVDEKQQLLAHLPFLFSKPVGKHSVYTVGLGSGILANQLAEHAFVDNVIVAELSKGVIEAVDYFAADNPKSKPKIQLVNDDGIRYLKHSTTSFDVIVSDGKSRPGAASNVAFFAKEYYELCERRLSPKGVFVQWVSLRCDARELVTIANTFAGAFPYGHIGFSSPGSIYLIGSMRPLQFDAQLVEQYLDSPNADSLHQYGFRSADDIFSMYWLDQTVLGSNRKYKTPPNSFDRPLLENFAWDSFRHSVQELPPPIDVLKAWIQSDQHSSFNGNSNSETKLSNARLASMKILNADAIVLAKEENWLDRSADYWKQALRILPNLSRQKKIASYYQQLALDARSGGDESTEFSALIQVIELGCGSAKDNYRAAIILESNGAHEQALKHHYDAVKQSSGNSDYQIAFAECLMVLQKFGRAKEELNEVFQSPQTKHLENRAKLLEDICEYKLSGDRFLLQRIALRATEDVSFQNLLDKFQIDF